MEMRPDVADTTVRPPDPTTIFPPLGYRASFRNPLS